MLQHKYTAKVRLMRGKAKLYLGNWWVLYLEVITEGYCWISEAGGWLAACGVLLVLCLCATYAPIPTPARKLMKVKTTSHFR